MEPWMKLVPGVCAAVLFFTIRRVARRPRERPEGTVTQMAHENPALRIIRPLLAIGFYAGILDWLVPGTRLDWSYHTSTGQLVRRSFGMRGGRCTSHRELRDLGPALPRWGGAGGRPSARHAWARQLEDRFDVTYGAWAG